MVLPEIQISKTKDVDSRVPPASNKSDQQSNCGGICNIASSVKNYFGNILDSLNKDIMNNALDEDDAGSKTIQQGQDQIQKGGILNTEAGYEKVLEGKLQQSLAPTLGLADTALEMAGSLDPMLFPEGNIRFTKLAETKAAAKSVPKGEPVSVATGEYLETWRDFQIPAALTLDGARYMSLKLPQPRRGTAPLGPCQICSFDEIFVNPSRGKLNFHDADGHVIRLERPSNFLASRNAAYPHLDLRAPWLKRLELRDRNLIKHFRQYDDTIYRLERIEDLNGNAINFHRTEAGVLEKADGTNSLALVFGNDSNGRRTRITLVGTDGSQLELARYSYGARGHMTAADCAFGMSVRYYWDTERDLLLRWHNLTRRSETQFTYDDDGRVVHTRTSGIWNGDRFRYDPQGRETTYSPSGDARLAQRFRYDDNNNVTHEIDALGGILRHTFDTAGFETSTTDANGHVTTMAYDICGNIKRHVDAEGRGTTYGWSPQGALDVVIDGAGHIHKYDNDNKGNCLAETDAEGHTSRYHRDERGRLLRTILPDGAEESRAYDAYGRLTNITDARGGVTRFVYDAFGRVVETADALGGITRTEYEAGASGFATPSAIVRPDGVRLLRAYTEDGLLASVTDGEGRTWRYTYGAFGVLLAIDDPGGGKLSLSYNGEGRVTAVTNQTGATYCLIRDAAGRIIAEEDYDGRRTEYTRDRSGRVVEMRKPDGMRLVYVYDRTHKLTSIKGYAADASLTGPPLDETYYWYDSCGLLIKASNQAALVEFERDSNGRIVSETVNGRRIESRLDARGNRIERCIGEGLVKIGRDSVGAVASLAIDDHAPLAFHRDPLGRETRRISSKGFKLDQAFDDVGQLTRQSVGQEGQAGRTYAWDKAGAPTLIDDALFGAASYRYDANGQVAQATFAKAMIERFDYDAAKNVVGVSVEGPKSGSGLGALLNVRLTPGGAVQLSHGPKGEIVLLTHDDCGRVIERRVERKGFRPKRWSFSWDVFDRLVSCLTPDGERWFYRYDPFGRRLTKVRQLSDTERAWVARKHRQLVSEADRDETALWTWPQLPNGHAAQDPLPPIVGTHFLWDGDVIAEEASLRLDGCVEWHDATRWHYEPDSFVPIAKQMPNGRLAYIVTDHLGTSREMFDEKGRLKWAASLTTWGTVRRAMRPPDPANDDGRRAIYSPSRSVGNLALALDSEKEAYDCPIRFLGQWADAETELYYNRYRYYDALSKQYFSSDPIGLAGGFRLQGYVENPSIWTDPLGLFKVASGMGGDAAPMKVERDISKGEKLDDITNELKARTFETGNEHAVITKPDGTRAIVSGGRDGIIIKRGDVKRIIGHTHPTNAPPSADDAAATKELGQSRQYVLHGGQVSVVRPK